MVTAKEAVQENTLFTTVRLLITQHPVVRMTETVNENSV